MDPKPECEPGKLNALLVEGVTWDGEMLLVVDVVPIAPPTEGAVVECWEDGDEDEGEFPTTLLPPLLLLIPACVAVALAAAAVLDGVFEFEVIICAQVGLDGEG